MSGHLSAEGQRENDDHVRSFLGFKNERQTIPHISVKAAKKMATPAIEMVAIERVSCDSPRQKDQEG
jgi:hypothetical protein